MQRIAELLQELKQNFAGELRSDPASRALYSTDASMYQIAPLGVAIPANQEDLQAALELAAKYDLPVLPRGAGSSLGGQAIGEALILDCSRHLNRILSMDAHTQTAVVEPGVVLADLNRAARKHGLMFGPDPASAERATMGGVIGNNATGAHSILYGMTADHLVSADVIMSDGSLATWCALDDSMQEQVESSGGRMADLVRAARDIRTRHARQIRENFPRSWRNSAGYRINYLIPFSPSKPSQWQGNYPPVDASRLNLQCLLAGSEGTLAVIQRATLKLVQKPPYTLLGVLAYPDIAAACDDVPRLLSFQPSAIELIPQLIIRLARGVPAYARQVDWIQHDPAAILVVEFSGHSLTALRESVQKIGAVLLVAEDPADQARVWNIRKMGLGILDSRPQSARPAAFIEDCAVPVENLGEFVREIENILAEHQAEGGIYAHASAGCLHIRPILDLQRGQGVRALRTIGERVLALTLRLGGSMSSEHGDGIVAGEWIEKTYGASLTDAMRALKEAADPNRLLNPGKMFEAPPMDTHLRYGVAYRTLTWQPALHFDHAGGLAGAIEQCNGQGVCRKADGVMCPSFQATRDEGNSTRGRANLLRTMIRMPGSAPADFAFPPDMMEDVYRSLDVCLACKGCTSECPSGVDMPRLKYEFMHRYFKTHPRQLRDYLFGYFDQVSKVLAPVGPLANALMKMDWSKKLIARLSGITDKRPFPAFAPGRTRRPPALQKSAQRVIYLSDVFSRYLEPEVERAAFELLQAAGYEPIPLSMTGAGTSLLSKGFIPSARAHAGRLLDEIRRLDPDALLPLVGCEPPEIYCVKHEYGALLPQRRQEVESLQHRAWTVEEFLLRVATKSDSPDFIKILNKISTKNQLAGKKISFHPHCHQRAEGLADDGIAVGASATVQLLQLFGYNVDLIDSGCCGMAGSFGYDAEHYELSMQVGELKLLPQIRALQSAGQASTLACSGSACRMQIKHATGVDAGHPLTLVFGELKN